LIGSSALHHLIRRNISGISAKTTEVATDLMPMNEPYGSVIQSLEPEFRRLGFIKTGSDNYSVTFSDGSNRIEIGSERYDHPSENEYFINQHGKACCLWLARSLMYPEMFKKEQAAMKAILEKYGVSDPGTPDEVRAEGMRLYLEFSLRHTIEFVESHMKYLTDLQ